MIVGRHVYYTGLCVECGVRRYVRRSDGRMGKHSPTPYSRGNCAGVGIGPMPDSLQCRECCARVKNGRITHRVSCAYMKGATHEVPHHVLFASPRTGRRLAADRVPEDEFTSAINERGVDDQ